MAIKYYRVGYKLRYAGGHQKSDYKYTPWTSDKEKVERLHFSFIISRDYLAKIEECVMEGAAA
jgi:hypothetical protein